MIGSLLYLTASRLDMLLTVGICACFHSRPKVSHLNAVKRIFKYFKGTMKIKLRCPKGITFDFVGCLTELKSMSGICYFMGDFLAYWSSLYDGALFMAWGFWLNSSG